MYSCSRFLSYLIGHLVIATRLCYAPDGSVSSGYGYFPCINTLNVDSMCCVLNVTELGRIGKTAADADECLTNGLCALSNGGFTGNYCTDKTWKSLNCLNVCTGGASGGTNSSYTTLTHCADGSWCCGQANLTSCCDVGLGFQLASAIPPYTAATATITVSSTSTSSPTSIPSSGNNSLGIGLGVALGVVLLAVAAVGLVLYRRRHIRSRQNLQLIGSVVGPTRNGPKIELEQPNLIHESPSQREPVELDGCIRKY